MDRRGHAPSTALERRLGPIRAEFMAGRLDRALELAEFAVRTDSREPAFLSIAARVLGAMERHERAIAMAGRALAITDHPEPRMVRGDALRALGRTDEALADLERALAMVPQSRELLLAVVTTLEEAGRTEEARARLGSLATSVPAETASDPRAAHEVAKIEVHDGRFDAAVARIDAALPAAGPGTIATTMLLHLRAKALDRAGRYDDAWATAMRSHADRGIRFDPASLDAAATGAIARWSREALRDEHGEGIDDPLPVFIAGMPRSGTSLVDQVIHAHPGAAGVGELETLERWAEAIGVPGRRHEPGSRIGPRYLAELRRLAPGLDFAVERFRPNLPIETSGGATGFVEEAWAGGVLAIGEHLRLPVDGGCPRCVITTLPQGDLPEDLEILRATARHNRVTAGVRLSVLAGGPLAVGDAVRWNPADPVAGQDGLQTAG